MPIIGHGLGPGGRGKDEVDLRRVTIYTPTSSPTMAVYVAECMMIEIGRINHLVGQIESVGDGSRLITLNGLEGRRNER